MHELYELKEMLCEELKEYGSKEKMDVGGLEIVDKLAHAIKNIDKIIEAYEEEGEDGYSGRYYYDNGNMSMRNDGGGSYARRSNRSYARGRGRNARRDSMGRYSRAGEDMVMELRELMEDAPDDRIRQEFQKLIQKIEQM